MSQISGNSPTLQNFINISNENASFRFAQVDNELRSVARGFIGRGNEAARNAAMNSFVDGVREKYGDHIANLLDSRLHAPEYNVKTLTGHMVKDLLAQCDDLKKLEQTNAFVCQTIAPALIGEVVNEFQAAHPDMNADQMKDVNQLIANHMPEVMDELVGSSNKLLETRDVKAALLKSCERDMNVLMAFHGKNATGNAAFTLESLKTDFPDLTRSQMADIRHRIINNPKAEGQTPAAILKAAQDDVEIMLAFAGHNDKIQFKTTLNATESGNRMAENSYFLTGRGILSPETGRQLCHAMQECEASTFSYASTRLENIQQNAGKEITRDGLWSSLFNEAAPAGLDDMRQFDFAVMVDQRCKSEMKSMLKEAGIPQNTLEDTFSRFDSALTRGTEFNTAMACLFEGKRSLSKDDIVNARISAERIHNSKTEADTEKFISMDIHRAMSSTRRLSAMTTENIDSTMTFYSGNSHNEGTVINVNHPERSHNIADPSTGAINMTDEDRTNMDKGYNSALSHACFENAKSLCNGNEAQTKSVVAMMTQAPMFYARECGKVLTMNSKDGRLNEHMPSARSFARLDNGDISVEIKPVLQDATSYTMQALVHPDGEVEITQMDLTYPTDAQIASTTDSVADQLLADAHIPAEYKDTVRSEIESKIGAALRHMHLAPEPMNFRDALMEVSGESARTAFENKVADELTSEVLPDKTLSAEDQGRVHHFMRKFNAKAASILQQGDASLTFKDAMRQAAGEELTNLLGFMGHTEKPFSYPITKNHKTGSSTLLNMPRNIMSHSGIEAEVQLNLAHIFKAPMGDIALHLALRHLPELQQHAGGKDISRQDVWAVFSEHYTPAGGAVMPADIDSMSDEKLADMLNNTFVHPHLAKLLSNDQIEAANMESACQKLHGLTMSGVKLESMIDVVKTRRPLTLNDMLWTPRMSGKISQFNSDSEEIYKADSAVLNRDWQRRPKMTPADTPNPATITIIDPRYPQDSFLYDLKSPNGSHYLDNSHPSEINMSEQDIINYRNYPRMSSQLSDKCADQVLNMCNKNVAQANTVLLSLSQYGLTFIRDITNGLQTPAHHSMRSEHSGTNISVQNQENGDVHVSIISSQRDKQPFSLSYAIHPDGKADLTELFVPTAG